MMTSGKDTGADEPRDRAVTTRMIAATTSQKNPFAEAGVGVVMGSQAQSARAAMGPRGSIPQAMPNSAAPSAMKPPDMGARFAPKPPPGKKPTAGRQRNDADDWVGQLDALG